MCAGNSKHCTYYYSTEDVLLLITEKKFGIHQHYLQEEIVDLKKLMYIDNKKSYDCTTMMMMMMETKNNNETSKYKQ